MYTDGIELGWFNVSLAVGILFMLGSALSPLVGDTTWPYKRRSFICGLPVGLAGVAVFYMLFTGAWPWWVIGIVAIPSGFIWGMVIYVLRMGILLGQKDGTHWDIAWHMDEWYPPKWIRFGEGAIHGYVLFGILVSYANSAVISP